MYVAAYEAKFIALSIYASLLITTKHERIRLYIRGLNFDLQVLSVHMTYAGRSSSEVTYYVKKVEGVRQDGQVKYRERNTNNLGNFRVSYSKVSRRPTLTTYQIQ